MLRISFTFILDTLFPPDRETLLVRRLRTGDIDSLYAPRAENGIISLTSFSSPTMRALLHGAKYSGTKEAYPHLAHLLLNYIVGNKNLKTALWMPLPLSRARMRARGYNQVTRVLRRCAHDVPDLTITETVLERVRNTMPQTELGRDERLTNMKNAFVCTHPEEVTGKDIVILDDVTTTGATLRAARDALLPHHPRSVTLLAIAH